MAFYSQLVEAYDKLFPFSRPQLEFVERVLEGSLSNMRIMDMGCGTGSLAIAMARRSAKVRAFDYDAEMIVKSNEKRPQALDLEFRQGDMKQTLAMYPDVKFDAVLCFGNTLVHLSSKEEVEKLFAAIAQQLNIGGKFVFQIINYDQVLDNKVDALPPIEVDEYSFVRNYIHREDGNIDFETALSTPDGLIRNTVTLLALRQREVHLMLAPYFNSIKCYGGFDESEWHSNSFHLVVEATK